MPFDSTPTSVRPDLSKPSLEGLIYLLRNLSTELPNHLYIHSYYAAKSDCGTAGCAYGVCQVMWPKVFGKPEHSPAIGVFLRNPTKITNRVFGLGVYRYAFASDAYGSSAFFVRPAMVADRLEEILHERQKENAGAV